MKKTKEKGVTLIALVITIILLLILASIGTTAGISTINSAKFSQFKSELKILQTKVNELNQNNEKNIGSELTDEQKNKLNTAEISNIIYNGRTEEEKTQINNGFRYCSIEYIRNSLNLDGVTRDYLINIEYRYVISVEGFEYEGITYYMSHQLEDGLYNVDYNNKNPKDGSFDVTATNENNRTKIEISNIVYNGYVDNWQVKYKLESDTYWKTSNTLSFYVTNDGVYNINVVHNDDIDLGTKNVKVIGEGLIVDKVRSGIIKIGDYVDYTPDTATTDSIISELGTYSGSTENTSSTLSQEMGLNWRVLDINESGEVRLISDVPTTSKISLMGYNGYNNAVYLLDETCRLLYSSSIYTTKVQNLKIEDIENKMVITDYTKLNSNYGKYADLSNKYYPSIIKEEKEQTIDGVTGTIGQSEQKTLINQTSNNLATSWNIKHTYWSKTMNKEDFLNEKYYELFINNGVNNSTYWMSSRCVGIGTFAAVYYIYEIDSNRVYVNYMYISDDKPYSYLCAFRPVITLKTAIQLDTTDIAKDGSTPTTAWEIK